MSNRKKDQSGFTLVETLASLVLLSIILLGFFQLFVHTNKTAKVNNEKLIVINLADGVLEGLKAKPMKEIETNNVQDYFTYQNPNNPANSIELNNRVYKVTYQASQSSTIYGNNSNSEKILKLIKVVVTVTAPDGKTKSTTEGYVSIE
ncbi:prepilin-type N-terminal cleavage/methylation domain-containing protein [Rummeliibacillus stabekisii]|uniref:prepilin-type N-terminal cleavage/methylation domain-containing protein n=1 Tax=Rummeliibacillus stabekisii TaxID=241244 RepID=UPI0020422F17|nr:prepilin-type N-terminal cleavage/methylation domain-containing protein [Rummeliibacillus stabekisii]MCM3316878.1 prepilin-type N-terminal cleavage/methylation domain-containing protein [Rummeliibacillus stabekisii]